MEPKLNFIKNNMAVKKDWKSVFTKIDQFIKIIWNFPQTSFNILYMTTKIFTQKRTPRLGKQPKKQ